MRSSALIPLVSWCLLLGGLRHAHAAPGDTITVSVLTYGPGSSAFDKFGHQAIRVRDTATRQDQVYNFGTYGFDSPALIPKFLMGRFQYWLSSRSYGASIRSYVRADRSIVEQVLNLTPAQRAEVKQRLETNLLPENRYYAYDYYLDNCATRPRDLIDAVIGGRLHEASREPAPLTFRQHTQRLTSSNVPFYLALHMAMGPTIDRPIDRWEEMFLPEKVEQALRRVTVPGPTGEEPLVKSENRIHVSARPPVPEAPPDWTSRFIVVGVLIGGFFAALGAAAKRNAVARVVFGSALALVGLVLGFFGFLFVFLWLCTDHTVAFRNENILQMAPWTLLLAAYGIGVARGRAPSIQKAFRVTAAAAGASLLGLLLEVAPWFSQDNAAFIALALPLWSGAAVGTWLLQEKSAKASAQDPAQATASTEGVSN
ncbi:DUF4105 domain-containing protein [Chondromyces crocatus]|uniref:Lnb N-terminal periplasmic domain-containing protein n=1 Tax=Chondromyces crocatus TaxID=52 RepID=A0A0K1EE91_CHOCO|nr:DUF4105 domain-containing protein [Chondromyces crocatus]AKT39007.1 uncharacterized protein CMC5_031530 [Chondromyces crocatus]